MHKALYTQSLKQPECSILFAGTSPGGPMVKNPPSNAGDVGSIPGRGTKIPHAAGQLSLHAATTEAVRSGTHVPQLERSPCAAKKDPACRN